MPKHYQTKVCQEITCGVKFTTSSHLAKYCPPCKEEVYREQAQQSNFKIRPHTVKFAESKQEDSWVNKKFKKTNENKRLSY
jgi:hypothetical protein